VKDIIDEALDSRHVGNPASAILNECREQQENLLKVVGDLQKDIAEFKNASITANKGDTFIAIDEVGIHA
jgi:hypothetical protein